MPNHPKKVRIVTLGCAKNDVDSEEIAGVLVSQGHSIEGDSGKVDAIVINTCGFLESAKLESVRAIKDAVRQKKAGKAQRVIVAGCLSQRLGEDLRRLAPGADSYIGVGQMARFGDILEEAFERSVPTVSDTPPQHLWAEVQTRARSGHPWSSYLKVSEGCDHQCTFCTIPSFRGKHVSKPLERVLEEAKRLAETGTKEINLIAQDVTQYGYDLYRKFTLPKLLAELNGVDGIEWIRILYFYPNRLTSEVIESIAGLPKVCHYVDIPLQHAHPEVLRAMKRPWDGERYLKLFERLRAQVPDCAIRTTFIVGFPGETDEHFSYLLDFLQEARLDRVGAFLFSREPGTPSYEMAHQVSEKAKKERFDHLMRFQQPISLAKNQAFVGQEISVLVESHQGNWSLGRSYRDAPEIDGLVGIEGRLPLGDLAKVAITEAEAYDLFSRQTTGKLSGLRRLPMISPK